jgi:hypothetical protein
MLNLTAIKEGGFIPVEAPREQIGGHSNAARDSRNI